MYAGISFDGSVWELWPYLLSGGRVIPVPLDRRLEIEGLVAFLKEQEITHTFLPTGICEQLIQSTVEELSSLKILTGGDELKIAGNPGIKLFNNYGPTESTVVSTSIKLKDNLAGTGKIPIGNPMSNARVYILDGSLCLVPLGVAGEICLSGAGLRVVIWILF